MTQADTRTAGQKLRATSRLHQHDGIQWSQLDLAHKRAIIVPSSAFNKQAIGHSKALSATAQHNTVTLAPC